VSSLSDYFATDWQAMTAQDWIGTTITVVIFLLMVVLYFHVLRPKNRDRIEAQRYIPLDDDESCDSGEKR